MNLSERLAATTAIPPCQMVPTEIPVQVTNERSVLQWAFLPEDVSCRVASVDRSLRMTCDEAKVINFAPMDRKNNKPCELQLTSVTLSR